MTTQGRLDKKVALITGGAMGIGYEIAKRFAAEGADLIIYDINAKTLDKAIAELQKIGTKVKGYVVDITDQKAVNDIVAKSIEDFKAIDILVNNAGIVVRKPFLEYKLEEFDRVMKVNIYGAFLVTQSVLPGMLARKQGKIIIISSTAGKWGSRFQSAYNISKHALVGMTRCLSLEMAPNNINVNAICPGLVKTDETTVALEQGRVSLAGVPLGRFIYMEEIASMAVFLASSESDAITGQSLVIDGGAVMV